MAQLVRLPCGGASEGAARQGPVIANVMPGLWTFTKSQLPFVGSKTEPAHSELV